MPNVGVEVTDISAMLNTSKLVWVLRWRGLTFTFESSASYSRVLLVYTYPSICGPLLTWWHGPCRRVDSLKVTTHNKDAGVVEQVVYDFIKRLDTDLTLLSRVKTKLHWLASGTQVY